MEDVQHQSEEERKQPSSSWTSKLKKTLTIDSLLDNEMFLKILVIVTYIWAGVWVSTQLFSDTTYAISTWIYFKLFGISAAVAYLSLYIQVFGLIGEEGITPIRGTLGDFDEYIQQLIMIKRARAIKNAGSSSPANWSSKLLGVVTKVTRLLRIDDKKLDLFYSRFTTIPTLFWLSDTDRFLNWICLTGLASSIGLIVGIGPVPVLVGAIYLCYLSIFTVSEDFLSLQWDVLLCESGILSFFLALSSYGFQLFHFLPSQAAEPSKLCVFLLQWLLFRLMFCSGVVKLSSRDPNWKNLKAMDYHYFTQPIPSPASHFMHNLPHWFHKWETLGTFFVELVLPFFFFAPLPLRLLAVLGTIQLNILISMTGNYGFFNLLTIVLNSLVLDDNLWLGKMSARSFGLPNFQLPSFSWSVFFSIPLFFTVMVISVDMLNRSFRTRVIQTPDFVHKLQKLARPLLLVNSYGLFAVMTTKRIELVVEGSEDGEQWLPYEFKYKPGSVCRTPPFIPGHMPRLDWMMWFLPFRDFPNVPTWPIRFLEQVMKSNQKVLQLLDKVPFPLDAPPKYLRVQAYDYTFTSREELRKSGQWWRRTLKGKFIPFVLANPKYSAEESD